MNVDTPGRSLLVAACVALGCSALVASAVYLLRPLQQDDSLLQRSRVIVDAAGRLPASGLSDAELLVNYLDLDAGIARPGSDELLAGGDAHRFDPWQSQEEPGDGAALPRQVPVYFARRNGRLERVVLPVQGAGMWSTIYAYVAFEADLNTIADIVFLRHGETPGIGDRIESPQWRKAWQGKRMFDDSGEPRLRVVKNARNEFEIDLISGASVTCEAIGEFVRNSFDDDGYGPLFERLRRERAAP